MHRLSVMLTVVCAVIGLARTGAAQGYQGAIRGAVHDAAGVVPGAEVRRQRSRPPSPGRRPAMRQANTTFRTSTPGAYTLKVALQGYKAYPLPACGSARSSSSRWT